MNRHSRAICPAMLLPAFKLGHTIEFEPASPIDGSIALLLPFLPDMDGSRRGETELNHLAEQIGMEESPKGAGSGSATGGRWACRRGRDGVREHSDEIANDIRIGIGASCVHWSKPRSQRCNFPGHPRDFLTHWRITHRVSEPFG